MSTLQIRRSLFKKVLVSLLLASFGLVAHAAAQTRMMPLGDSITEGTGSSHDGGYRHDLYYSLQNANIAFDFVGSLQYGTGFRTSIRHLRSGQLVTRRLPCRAIR